MRGCYSWFNGSDPYVIDTHMCVWLFVYNAYIVRMIVKLIHFTTTHVDEVYVTYIFAANKQSVIGLILDQCVQNNNSHLHLLRQH